MDKNLIDKNNIQDILSLTPMQEGMLFHYMLHEKSKEYLEQLCLSLSGVIDIDCIKDSWDFVAERNETLRTIFRWEKIDKPVQIILLKHQIPLIYHDISEETEERKEILLRDYKKKDIDKNIDLASEPFRITFIKVSENSAEMILTNHHIVLDGWSTGLLVKEFIEAYNCLIGKGGQENMPGSGKKTKLREFIKLYLKQDKEKQREFWENYLEGYIVNEGLSKAGSFKKTEANAEGTHIYRHSSKLLNSLESFCRKENVTIAAVIYTAWGILLQKYLNEKDVVFGTTIITARWRK